MISLFSRAIVAICFSLSLFVGMSYLIKPGEMPPAPTDEDTKINILRKERPKNPLFKKLELPTPPKNQDAPPPMVARSSPTSIIEGGFSLLQPLIQKTTSMAGMSPGNRRAIPIVRFPPEYPQRLIQRNIEGWVMLEFTIAPDGSVTDIKVVDAEPENAFEKAASRSIAKWRYQPKVIDGRPVAQHHMREVFRFEIEK